MMAMRTRPLALPMPLGAGLLLGGALLMLGACTEDPFDRPGTWRPSGANEANLRAQIVDPAQLRRVVGAGTDRGSAGTQPITVLEAGERPPVPSTELTGIGGGGAGGGATGAR